MNRRNELGFIGTVIEWPCSPLLVEGSPIVRMHFVHAFFVLEQERYVLLRECSKLGTETTR